MRIFPVQNATRVKTKLETGKPQGQILQIISTEEQALSNAFIFFSTNLEPPGENRTIFLITRNQRTSRLLHKYLRREHG